VYASLSVPVGARDTSGDLLGRLAVTGARLLVGVLDALEDGAAVATPQAGEATLAPKIGVEEARVDWRASAAEVDRLVRGCTPDPGAWTTFRGERVKLGPVVPVATDEATDLAPGAVVVEKKRVLVGAGGGAVALGSVQAAGKKAMSATDWARGTRPAPGEEFA
jgi:methionyl-tRNA formyltransferase